MATLVLNVPYGGLFMPPMVAKRLALKPVELGWENFRLTDPCLLAVVSKAASESVVKGFLGEKSIPPRTMVSYNFSPLVSDPLGFLATALKDGGPKDSKFITASSSGKNFPPWSPEERELIMKKSSNPYLNEINDKCLQHLETGTLVLLLTIRSFSSRPWNFETERRYPRPQICIGTNDDIKCPKGLANFLGKTFRIFNFWPELNWPHKGAFVPAELLDRPRLFAVGLSFRRDLYMDESTGKLIKGHVSLVRILRTVFSLLEEELETVLKIRYKRKHPPKPPSMVLKGEVNQAGNG